MNDREFLKQKIAEAQASNKELEAELENMEANDCSLAEQLAELRKECEKGDRIAARLSRMSDDQEETRREIAKLRGEQYRDPDDPDYEYPESRDEPD